MQARSISIKAKSLDRAKPRLHGLYASEQLGLQPGTNFPLGFQLSWLSCRSALEQGLHHGTAMEDASGRAVSSLRVNLWHGLLESFRVLRCTAEDSQPHGYEIPFFYRTPMLNKHFEPALSSLFLHSNLSYNHYYITHSNRYQHVY